MRKYNQSFEKHNYKLSEKKISDDINQIGVIHTDRSGESGKC